MNRQEMSRRSRALPEARWFWGLRRTNNVHKRANKQTIPGWPELVPGVRETLSDKLCHIVYISESAFWPSRFSGFQSFWLGYLTDIPGPCHHFS